MKKKIILFLSMVFVICSICLLSACFFQSQKHTHNYSEEWKYNDNFHWQECECGDKIHKNTHYAGPAPTPTTPQTCVNCGYVMAEPLEQKFEFKEIKQDDVVTGYSVSIGTIIDEDIEIPDTYNDKPVTRIASFGFASRKIKNVKIPDSITYIEYYAFGNCEKLENITFGKNVKYIGESAFANCISLQTVTLQNEVIGIYNSAFQGCTNLEKAQLGNSIEFISNKAFATCTSLTDISIPDSIESIYEDTFENCTSLILNEYDNAYYLGNENNKTVVLVKAKSTDISECAINTKTRIVFYNAFKDCSNLLSVSLPETVVEINPYAFYGCEKLNTIIVPEGITSLGVYTFGNCTNLAEINLPTTLKYVYSATFDGCGNIRKATLPTMAISAVPKTALKEITLTCGNDGNHVKGDFLDNQSYQNCINLEKVTVSGGISKIGANVFYGCTNLTDISLPDSLTEIGDNAFFNCAKLKTVNYGNAEYIGNEANPYLVLLRYAGQGISDINVHDDTKVIAYRAFRSCSTLKTITLPSGLKSIGDEAFRLCNYLNEINLPDGVTSIGSYAFAECIKLTEFELPDSVTFLGAHVFDGCKNLETVKLSENLSAINYNTFANCTKLVSVTLPNNISYVGEKAFENCTALTSVTFGTSISRISINAFKGCSADKCAVYLPDGSAWKSSNDPQFDPNVVGGVTVIANENENLARYIIGSTNYYWKRVTT